jgi:hypothetical protein
LKEIGVTWLELFLHYSLSGGSAVTAKSEHLRLTHSRLFNSFKKRSKQLFKFGSPGTRPLLKASTASPAGGLWPLAAYGMQAKLPTLPFNLALGRDVTARIHAGLCSYGAKVPSTSQLPTKLRNAKLKLPRFAPWEHLREHSFPLFEMSARYINRSDVERSIHNQTISHEGFWLRCPQCNDTRDLRSITLYRGNSVCRIRCIMCKHTCTSKKWTCLHALPWIACAACRPAGFLCKTPARLKRPRPANSADDDLPLWVPRTARLVKRRPHPHILSTTATPTAGTSAAAVAHATSSATTTARKREGSALGDQEPRSKKRLLFVPGPRIQAKLACLV